MSVPSAVIETGNVGRRDYLIVATGAVATVGTALALWRLIDSMNSDALVLSVASMELDLRTDCFGPTGNGEMAGRTSVN